MCYSEQDRFWQDMLAARCSALSAVSPLGGLTWFYAVKVWSQLLPRSVYHMSCFQGETVGSRECSSGVYISQLTNFCYRWFLSEIF